MAVKIKRYTQAELHAIDKRVKKGQSWDKIAVSLGRSSGNAIYQRYMKFIKNKEHKVIEVNKQEAKSVTFSIKGVEITMVFK
jgi:uncharacterized protein (DUF4213/DUF364 family)